MEKRLGSDFGYGIGQSDFFQILAQIEGPGLYRSLCQPIERLHMGLSKAGCPHRCNTRRNGHGDTGRRIKGTEEGIVANSN